MEHHVPVLLAEVLERLHIRPGQIACDGTLGSAGHATAMIRALGGRGTFVGFDRDPEMLRRGRMRIETEGIAPQPGVRIVLRAESYEQLPAVLAAEGLPGADAVLLDLGINSLQVDDPARGFAFSKEGPLDGRFDPADPRTRSVEDLVNNASEAELTGWMREYADEKFARSIARRIAQARAEAPIRTTTQLAAIVASGYPPKARHQSSIHPATRAFQALRIVANDELGAVERGVRACLDSLTPGGTLCVISYHSGEDRIVKRLFDEAGSPRPDPANIYSATSEAGMTHRVEKRGAVLPTEAETAVNPRARSARLRTIRRLGGDA